MAAKVKRTRRYDATRRQEAAQRRRAAIIEAATVLFVREGFAGTTISRIAADAGVSEETVYKVFGNKVALVRAIRDKALAGAGPVHAERRSDRMQSSERDPRNTIRGWSVLAMEVAPRVMPVLLLIRQAGGERSGVGTIAGGNGCREADADDPQRADAAERRTPATGQLA